MCIPLWLAPAEMILSRQTATTPTKSQIWFSPTEIFGWLVGSTHADRKVAYAGRDIGFLKVSVSQPKVDFVRQTATTPTKSQIWFSPTEIFGWLVGFAHADRNICFPTKSEVSFLSHLCVSLFSLGPRSFVVLESWRMSGFLKVFAPQPKNRSFCPDTGRCPRPKVRFGYADQNIWWVGVTHADQKIFVPNQK